MIKLLSFIGAPIAGYVFGGLLIASLIGHVVSWGVNHFEFADMVKQRDDAIAQTRDATRSVDRLSVNVATLDATLASNISQIKAWQAEGADATKRAEANQETVRKTVAAVRANVLKLVSAAPTAPLGSFEACKAGIQSLRGIEPVREVP